MMSGQLKHNKVSTEESHPFCQGLPALSCPFSTSWECWEQPLAILEWVTHCPGMNGYLVQAAEMVRIAAGESLGQGSERPRLCAQINAWSADKTQLSFLCSCWSPAGVKEEAWVFVSFYSSRRGWEIPSERSAQWVCNPCAAEGILAVSRSSLSFFVQVWCPVTFVGSNLLRLLVIDLS